MFTANQQVKLHKELENQEPIQNATESRLLFK